MSERMKIQKLSDAIYLLNDADEGTAYLVLGTEKALVIDTTNGVENFYEIIRTLTDLPLVLVNTHAHPDHVRGNVWFDKAYINFRDREAYYDMFRGDWLPDAIKGLTPCPIENLDDGDTIDLGGRVIEVIAFRGHTEGGLCLLSREDRVLFTGDSVLGRMVWMFMENSVTLSELCRSLENLNTYRDAFDHLLTGHGIGYDTPELIDRVLEAARAILAGKTDRAGTFETWGESYPCYYYTGENDCDAPLVYREDLKK